MKLETIHKKIQNNERILPEEGLFLLQNADLLELGNLGNDVRFKKNPNSFVTFVIDTNPNYSNICTIDCTFCAFYRHRDEEGAYTYTVDEMIKKFKDAKDKGVTTILLQGGVHPDLPLEYYIEMVKRTVQEIPGITPHFYSTSEIAGMAKVSGLTTREVLIKLWEAGMRTIPGGGAEILSDRIKKKISHMKGRTEEWITIMREAHEIGYKTTATMMFGHLEDDRDIIEHLEVIRHLQDENKGFTAFIPWSFKPGNTPLNKIIRNHASSIRYLQMIALSRIYLDNFDHIQASWFSEGKKAGQIALHFGADDFGGTLFEENVHAEADFINKSSVDEVIRLIREAGFIPAQRNTLYDIIKVYNGKLDGKY